MGMLVMNFLTGLRQRRDAGGTWLRLFGVSAALAVLQVAPLAMCIGLAYVWPTYRPDMFITTGLALVFGTAVLASFLRPVRWKHAKGAPPLVDDPAVLGRMQELAARMGLRLPVVRMVHSPSSQKWTIAMVSGLAAPSVLIGDGILHRLSEDECDAIIAHELAHLANRTFWFFALLITAVTVAMVVAAAFVPFWVALGFGFALFVGLHATISRQLELDCDRRAARAMGFRRAASALFKIHADQPFRRSPWLEFLIGATSTHPSRDERLAALHAIAPAEDQPQVEWHPANVRRRQFASALACAVWLLCLAGCLAWARRSPGGWLPAIPLVVLGMTPTLLLLLGMRRSARRHARRTRVGFRWRTLLGWTLAAVFGGLAIAIWTGWLNVTGRPDLDEVAAWGLGLAAFLSCSLLQSLDRSLPVKRKLEVAIQSGDYQAGLALGVKHPRIVARSPGLRHDLALVRAVVGERREAIAELEKLCRDVPKLKQTWITLANLYADEGEHERALELATELTQALRNDPAGPILTARALRKLGRLDEAEAAARKVLEKEPELGDAQAVLAGVLLDRGDLAGAREHLAQAERFTPGTTGVSVLAAEIALAAGDPRAAALVGEAEVSARRNRFAFMDRQAAALAARVKPPDPPVLEPAD
jgi:Zn-dependent protease with chaperone function